MKNLLAVPVLTLAFTGGVYGVARSLETRTSDSTRSFSCPRLMEGVFSNSGSFVELLPYQRYRIRDEQVVTEQGAWEYDDGKLRLSRDGGGEDVCPVESRTAFWLRGRRYAQTLNCVLFADPDY